jgi:hypothetical protein
LTPTVSIPLEFLVSTSDSDFIPFFVSRVTDQAPLKERNKVATLLDTGSLAGNFVVRHIVDSLRLSDEIISHSNHSTVCSGLDNQCLALSNSIFLKLSYFCSILNKFASFSIQAFILDKSPVDLIIGKKSIKEHNLFQVFPRQISLDKLPITENLFSEHVSLACGCQPKGEFATPKGTPKGICSTQSVDPAVTQTHVILAS